MESISEALARSFGVHEIFDISAENYDDYLDHWIALQNGEAIVCGLFRFLEVNPNEPLGFGETWLIASTIDPGSDGYDKKGVFNLDKWCSNEMAAKSSLVSGYKFQYDEAAVRSICLTLFRWRRRLEHRWEQKDLRRIIENIRIRAGHYPNRPTVYPRFPNS